MNLFKRSLNVLSYIVCALACVADALAQTPCTPLQEDISIRSTLASAGFFDNVRNSDDSIRYQMDQLLSQSESKASEMAGQRSPCGSSCSSPLVAVVFSSRPNMTLREYEDSASCQKLLETTRQHPIVYSNRTFDAQNEAEEWYNDLTQGDGMDGEDLYNRCPGRCSPNYTSVIYRNGGKYFITTSIICGHARDKDDNHYRLTSSLRWICL